MKLATAKEKELLAKKVKTSVAYLRQLASGHRKAGLELAFEIEKATAVLPAFIERKLPVVYKETLNKRWVKFINHDRRGTMNERFWVNFIDEGNCEINSHPIELYATSLANALQKAAAIIPDDTAKVIVFSD